MSLSNSSEEIGQGFGFIAESRQKEADLDADDLRENEILPFPLRNPLTNVKDAKKPGSDTGGPVFGFGYGKATTQPVIKPKEILAKVGASLQAALLAHRGAGGKKQSQAGKSHRLILDMTSDGEQASAIRGEGKDILNLSRVDKCLISMEELEMDIKNMIHHQLREPDLQEDINDESKEGNQNPFFTEAKSDERYGELADPVRDQYVQLLKNIMNLCQDPSIISVLIEGLTSRKGKPLVVSSFEKEKVKQKKVSSQDQSAKNILVRAIEKMMKVENQTLSEAQIEDLHRKVKILKNSIAVKLMEAANPTEET